MINNSDISVRIYTHYYPVNNKTLVTVVHFDCNTNATYSFITERKVTEMIIKDLDSLYTNKAIRFGGFYFNDKFITIRRTIDSTVTINNELYRLE